MKTAHCKKQVELLLYSINLGTLKEKKWIYMSLICILLELSLVMDKQKTSK